MDYQGAVNVDRNNLDEEAIRIPGWYGNVVEKEAESADEWDALKDKMSVVKADIGLILRGWSINKINQFFNLELTKLTEGVYTNLIYIHPEVLDLYNRIAEARHKTLLYRAATKSFEKKGDMLKELAKLFAQGYYLKIEGSAYKEAKVNLIVEGLKAKTVERIKREDAGKASPPDLARQTLQSKFDAASAGAKAPKVTATQKPKTPKTPKTEVKRVGRVKG